MNESMLHAYLDGELNAEDTKIVEAALASDPHWAAEYEALVAVDDAIGTLPGLEVGAEFDALAKVPAKAPRMGRLVRMVVPLAAAAAALAFVWMPPKVQETAPVDVFSQEEVVQYVYWEADADTYGSGDLQSLEDAIVAELEAS